MKKVFVFALVMLFAASAQAFVGQQMIVNGDMELDVDANGPDDWHNFDNPPSDNTGWVQTTDIPPGGGTYSGKLIQGPASGPHWLWQDLTVTPETDYLFDFWWKGTAVDVHFEASTGWHGDHMGGGVVFWEWWDQYVIDGIHNPETMWTHATHADYQPEPWIVTTLPGQTHLRVQFINQWANGNMFIDNVSLVEIPEPATLAVLALGFLGALIRRRR